MPYKVFNKLFPIFWAFLILSLILIVVGLAGVLLYKINISSVSQMIPPNIDQTEYAWAVPSIVAGPLLFIIPMAIGFYEDGLPQIKVTCYTEDEQEAMRNNYLDIMRAKGFTFNEDKDVL